jgi:hypothetical protein
VETALCGQIEILESDKKKLKSAFCDEREYHEKYLQGTEKVEAAHYSLNEGLQNRLQERIRRIRELEATLHWQCVEIFIVHTEARLERESVNRRIKELENKFRETDFYREKVEAAPHGRIKQLNKKPQDTYNERKEVESSLSGKVTELAAVSVEDGLVVGRGGGFFHKSSSKLWINFVAKVICIPKVENI